MKKLIGIFVGLFMVVLMSNTYAQTSNYDLAQNSWSYGFGFSYPRYISFNTYSNDKLGTQLGLFASIQRNFSEHVGIRMEGNYIYLKDTRANIKNSVLVANFDLLYYFVPVEKISPYLGVGLGGFLNSITGSKYSALNKSHLDYQLNLSFGAEWAVAPEWRIKTELGYHTPSSSGFDGSYGTTGYGILGGNFDSYMTFDLGAVYYFNKGPKSHLNDLYEGLTPKINYKRIEDIVKKYATKPIEIDYNRIENIVKRHQAVSTTAGNKWVLLGVNFDFGKTSIRPESLPILYNAVEILLTHPNIDVEIQGYTDNIGSKKYNEKLSLERAQSVEEFLVAKGVSSGRLTVAGYGEANPVVSNKTTEGRSLNRRIEFKILSR